MNGKELLAGVGYVDERFVEEAEYAEVQTFSGHARRKWISAAACLSALLLGGLVWMEGWLPGQGSTESAGDSTISDQEHHPESETGALQIPEMSVVGDGPIQIETSGVLSITLKIQSLLEDGFVGTVWSQADSELFDVGTELTVVLSMESQPVRLTEGMLVTVQIISYDQDADLIVVNQMIVTGKDG